MLIHVSCVLKHAINVLIHASNMLILVINVLKHAVYLTVCFSFYTVPSEPFKLLQTCKALFVLTNSF